MKLKIQGSLEIRTSTVCVCVAEGNEPSFGKKLQVVTKEV